MAVGGGEVERLVGGEVLLVAVVEDVAESGGTRGERHLEDSAIAVSLHRLQGCRPVGGVRGTGPDVQPPAVVVAVGAVVVQDGLGGVLRRVVGPLGDDVCVALRDPHLAGLRDVDGAIGGDVLVPVLVDDEEADVRRARLELHPGEGAVRVTPGEGVPGGPGGRLAVGQVAPRVQVPVGVVAVGALVVDDRVVAGGSGGDLLGGRGAGGGGGGGARGTAGGVDDDRLVPQGGAGLHVRAEGLGDLVGGAVGGAEDPPRPGAGLGGEDDTVELSAVDVGGQFHGAGGTGRRGLEGERRLGGGLLQWCGRLEDDRGTGGDGDGDLAVVIGGDVRLGAVDAPVGHAGGAGGEGGRLRVTRVVEGDDVLLLVPAGPGEGVDTGPVGRVPLGLDPVGEGGVGLAQLGEGRDLLVERG